MKSAFFLADDFIHSRHGVAVYGEPADGYVAAVGDKTLNCLWQAHHFFAVVIDHLLSSDGWMEYLL